MNEAAQPNGDSFSSVYGVEEWEFSQLLVAYERIDQEDQSPQACDRLVFKPEDAAELKKLLETLKEKPRARALLAMLMDVHHRKALAERVENAMHLVPKARHQSSPRANTMGTFFAGNVPLSEQSHLTSN